MSCDLLSYAQEQSLTQKISHSLKLRQKRKDSLINAGKPFLSIYAGPGYTPEAGLLIGGGLLYTFSTNPSNPDLQRSSIPLMGSISTKGNVSLNSTINTFWLEDKLRVKLIAKFSNVQDDYFGIGYNENSSIDKGEETSTYNRVFYQFQPQVNVRVFPNLFLGAAFLYSRFKVKDTNPVMEVDPNYLEFGPEIKESGPIFNMTFDKRDFVVNAYRGMYFNISYYKATNLLGGNQNYQSYEFDARYYQSLSREANTLAFRIYGRQAIGAVPYSAMTLIGSTDLLRGYLNGRYRDKTGLVFLSEWRYMFLKNEQEISKHGMVLWLGSGSVGADFGALNNWLPNGGLGYRYEVQPRMNVRIDFGIGKQSAGLYFNFSEAF